MVGKTCGRLGIAGDCVGRLLGELGGGGRVEGGLRPGSWQDRFTGEVGAMKNYWKKKQGLCVREGRRRKKKWVILPRGTNGWSGRGEGW